MFYLKILNQWQLNISVFDKSNLDNNSIIFLLKLISNESEKQIINNLIKQKLGN